MELVELVSCYGIVLVAIVSLAAGVTVIAALLEGGGKEPEPGNIPLLEGEAAAAGATTTGVTAALGY